MQSAMLAHGCKAQMETIATVWMRENAIGFQKIVMQMHHSRKWEVEARTTLSSVKAKSIEFEASMYAVDDIIVSLSHFVNFAPPIRQDADPSISSSTST